jgi:hypothetical protein
MNQASNQAMQPTAGRFYLTYTIFTFFAVAGVVGQYAAR